MKLFESIRNYLSKINLMPTSNQSNPLSHVDIVAVDENRELKESIRKQFAEQEQAMQIRSFKAHGPSCPDNWTCKKEPCFIIEPDRIIVHKKKCVHANGIIMTESLCKCGIRKKRIKDKDFNI
ncbi:MAG TPA: hypothetical protein VHA52_02185 [Candidatus Babeliaceae bacterium]|nr:hypothetical protein [Candidatus Babeliaceae bacterium]